MTDAQAAKNADEKANVSYLIQKGNIRAKIAEKKSQSQSQLLNNLVRRPMELFLIVCQVVCLGISLFLMSYPDSRVGDKLVMNNLFTGQTESEDLGNTDGEKRLTIVLQYMMVLASGFLSVVLVVLMLLAMRLSWSTSSTYTLVVVLLTCLSSDLVNVAYPNNMRLGLVITTGALRMFSLGLIVLLNIWLASEQRKQVGQELPMLLQSFQEISQFIGVDDPNLRIPMVLLEELESWIVEARGKRALLRGRTAFLAVCVVLFFLFTGTMVTESEKVLFEQNMAMQENSLDRLSERVTYSSSIETRTQTARKVTLLVVSGLRYDAFETNTKLATFWDSIKSYGKLYKFKTSVPSTSVAAATTLLTGSSPEFHGQLNDFNVQETSIDSIYNMTRLYSVRSAMIADSNTVGIVRNLIPPLDGDGTVPTAASTSIQELVLKSVFGVDNQRTTLLNAASLAKKFQFITAKLDNLHIQAQMRGVDTKWNSDDSYQEAINYLVDDLYDFWDTLDSNDVVLLVSDHGHIDRGGTGGVHDTVMNIPVVLYGKAAGLSSSWSYTGPKFEKSSWDLRDLTPTICAILGISAPRNNFGVFFDDAMIFATGTTADLLKHYEDLFYQKQSLYWQWMKDNDLNEARKADIMSTSYVSGMTLSETRDAIKALDDYYSDEKYGTYVLEVSRNVCVSFALILVITGLMMMILQNGTLADPASALFQLCLIQRVKTTLYTRCKNVLAVIISFVFICWYYILAITAFCLGLLAFGYLDTDGVIIWDSSIVSNPVKGGSIFLLLALGPGLVIYPVIKRIQTALLVNFLEKTEKLEFVEVMRTLAKLIIIPSRLTFRDYGLLYLLNIYMLFWTSFTCLFILLLASDFTFMVPLIFRLKHIDGGVGEITHWGYRFRIITMMYMSVPLLIGTLASTYNWHSQLITPKGIGSLHSLAEQKGNIYIALFGGFSRRKKDVEVARAIEKELRGGVKETTKKKVTGNESDEENGKDLFGQDVDQDEYSINFIMASKQQVAEHCMKLQHKMATLEKEIKVLKTELEDERDKHKEMVRGEPVLDDDDLKKDKKKDNGKYKQQQQEQSMIEGLTVTYEARLKREKAKNHELEVEKGELQECYKECAAERKVVLEKLLQFDPHYPMDKKDPYRRRLAAAAEAGDDAEQSQVLPAGRRKKGDNGPSKEPAPFG